MLSNKCQDKLQTRIDNHDKNHAEDEEEDDKKPELEAEIYLLATCIQLKLNPPFEDISIQELGLTVALVDFLIVFLFVLAAFYQKKVTEVTVQEFEEMVVKVKDFSIEVTGLPPVSDYKDERILEAMIW